MRGVYLVMVAALLCLGAGVVSAQVSGVDSVNAKVYLDENDFNDTVDFGFIIIEGNSTLGNRVWMDLNKNGTQDGGEPGIEEIKVDLWHLDLDIKYSTTTTGKNGTYWFYNLPAGNYTVSIDMNQDKLKKLTATTPNQGDNDSIDSDGIKSSNPMLIV